MKATLIVAEGLAEMVSVSGGKTTIPAKFKEYVESVFPFMEKSNAGSDEEMKAVMKREAAKGPIQFASANPNTFKSAAKRLSMPDDFKKKLQAKAKGSK